MIKIYRFAYFFFVSLIFSVASRAQLTFTPIISGLAAPMEVMTPPDGTGRLFIIERSGTVRIYSGATLLPDVFLNITPIVNTVGERGFLSMAFHPGYATNGYFFVLYNNSFGDLVLTRFQTDAGNANHADSSLGVQIFSIAHPGQSNHNGGKLAFGTDGNLYWSTGDGGGSNDPLNNAQNGNSLLGKMLRLNVDNFTTPPFYTIPATNPFVSDVNVADEIWNLGLRNPFRWSFDRLNGDMWIADVGQGTWEEVDHSTLAASAGLNYGWRCREGAHPFITGGCSSTYTDPVFEYSHALGSSITGGYVYRGSASPALYGKYVCIDFVSGNAFTVTPGAAVPYVSVMTAGPLNISGFGENASGELFAVSLGGTLYSVSDPVALPLTLMSFTATKSFLTTNLQWTTVQEQKSKEFMVERSVDGKDWIDILHLKAKGDGTGVTNYEAVDAAPAKRANFYRLKMIDMDGSFLYSDVQKVIFEEALSFEVYPNPAGEVLYVQLDKGFDKSSTIRITNALNQEMQVGMNVSSGQAMAMNISALASGIYYVKIISSDNHVNVRRFIKK